MTEKPKGVGEAPNTTSLSPPSSSSTMSGTKLAEILQDLTSPPQQKQLDTGSQTTEGDIAVVEVLKNDRDFVPLDVTSNQEFVFCVSQPPRKKGTVQVFHKDGSIKGVLKLQNHVPFDNPRSVARVPCSPNDYRLVVLDDSGIHVFNQSGEHQESVAVSGEAANYRGLAHYTDGKSWFLVTLDIGSASQGVYIKTFVMPDLIEHKFLVSKDPEADLKCRFVACISPADGAADDGAPLAYVTSMAKGKVFQVDLLAQTSKEMSLARKVVNDMDLMPPPPPPPVGRKAERTFVDNEVTIADETLDNDSCVVSFQEPTGIAIDDRSGDIYIGDKSANTVHRFNSEGMLIQSLRSHGLDLQAAGDKTHHQLSPIGLHFDSNDGLLYVSSNRCRSVFVCRP